MKGDYDPVADGDGCFLLGCLALGLAFLLVILLAGCTVEAAPPKPPTGSFAAATATCTRQVTVYIADQCSRRVGSSYQAQPFDSYEHRRCARNLANRLCPAPDTVQNAPETP